MLLPYNPVPLQPWYPPEALKAGVRCWVQRDDLLHPTVSGNKFRKLRYNLETARQQGHHTLLSFGGAYSNHLAALAAAAQIMGFQSIGLVRGEEHSPLNPVLQFCKEQGMVLHYISRSEYREKEQTDWLARFGKVCVLPEGGSNALAVRGVAELPPEWPPQLDGSAPDYVLAAVGTGATLAGLIEGSAPETRVIGIPVLRDASLPERIQSLLSPDHHNWQLNWNYHFGGYARKPEPLLQFVQEFIRAYAIPIEPVYTGKLFFATTELLQQGYFPHGARVVVLHSGGVTEL
jgi:1-aminocyclopropane-1-carboxylate deaminase